jgi:hypothetical protein
LAACPNTRIAGSAVGEFGRVQTGRNSIMIHKNYLQDGTVELCFTPRLTLDGTSCLVALCAYRILKLVSTRIEVLY